MSKNMLEIKNVTKDDIKRKTSDNFLKLFNITKL